MQNEFIAIIDFGSQYTQLIARRVREASVYCEILTPDATPEQITKDRKLKGVILSGGPASVYARGAPKCDRKVLDLPVPVLGICYGMQLATLLLGSKVKAAKDREFGSTDIKISDGDPLFRGVPRETTVWMSHGDRVEANTKEFAVLAATKNCPYAAVRHKQRRLYGVQFHPEVTHTPQGSQILRNFVYAICGCRGDWEMKSYIDSAVAEIRRTVGPQGRVICGLSGGVDSAVAATMVHKAVQARLTCVFVDNGLLRKDEGRKVRRVFGDQMHLNLVQVDAGAEFLRKLKGVRDPEKKRTVIGHTFVDVFERESKKLKGVGFLAQGTLYPDVIESRSAFGGPSAKIKTHHNVGGLPEKLKFKLIEPLRFLFKDEVRRIGRELSLPEHVVDRQPFPGPGLGVRCLGELTKERLEMLREADEIVTKEIEKAGVAKELWQYFAVLLTDRSVGVMGDERTYQNALAVRAVNSSDGMTADWARLPADTLSAISSRIINEVKGVNRVVYDVSSKPPSTIEWE